MTKICNTCKQPKELKEFSKEPRSIDGRKGDCIKCKRERDRIKYYEKKKERELYF